MLLGLTRRAALLAAVESAVLRHPHDRSLNAMGAFKRECPKRRSLGRQAAPINHSGALHPSLLAIFSPAWYFPHQSVTSRKDVFP